MLGYNSFDKSGSEGDKTKVDLLNTDFVILNKEFKISRKVVAIGLFNENWGWLSTYFLNRTIYWSRILDGDEEENPYKPQYRAPVEQIRSFLDNPNIVMLVVNTHHNCSHPKVISFPLGIEVDAKSFWISLQRGVRNGVKKQHMLYSAG